MKPWPKKEGPKGKRPTRIALSYRVAGVLVLCMLARALPAQDIYVDPNYPGASDAGSGAADQPFVTFSRALRKLQAGDQLHIAPGTYRETLDLRLATQLQTASSENTSKTVIAADPGAVATINGADIVSQWKSLGGGDYVLNDWTVNSQQVFVDGRPLQQIGGTIFGGYPERADHPLANVLAATGGIWPGRVAGGSANMPNWSFYYDAAARRLYMRVPFEPLGDHKVEISVRPYLAIGSGLRNVTLRNLRFEHANTTAIAQSGAISIVGSGIELDNLTVTQVDGAGADISGDNNTVHNSVFSYCGQVGLKARGANVEIADNQFSYNNTRGFNKWWEAGGAKFVGDGGLRNSVVARNLAYANQGDGIWFDWHNDNNDIHNNISAYNRGFGIQYEASNKANIHDNYFFSNKQRGIYLPNSTNSIIGYNLVLGNGLEGIVVVDVRKSPTESSDLIPNGNRVIGNILAWNQGRTIILPDNGVNNHSDYNLIVSKANITSQFSLGWGSNVQPLQVGLDNWRAATGNDIHSQTIVKFPSQRLSDAIENQLEKPDWTELLSEGMRIQVPLSLTEAEPVFRAAGPGS